MDPRTAHSRLLAERGRLERRAQALFAQLGLKPGSTGEGFAALMARGDGAFADSEAGRADAVAFMNAILDVARADLPRWF
ncbi:hypothetical protein ABTN76_20690, partial [Acinetobacter baumannii]